MNKNVKGLYYFNDVITEDEENELYAHIYNQEWLTELSRRVIHYGYKYDYRKRKINKDDYLGELPIWTTQLQKTIFDLIDDNEIKVPYKKFDQLIINEYKAGQGISAHIDCVPCFEDGIVTVTIGCSGIMTFVNSNSGESYDIKLKRGSVAILTGDSRYKWTHELNKAKNKKFTDEYPRISLTFRKCKI
jgi:alkylated DNA repair dioxygenase AlkB